MKPAGYYNEMPPHLNIQRDYETTYSVQIYIHRMTIVETISERGEVFKRFLSDEYTLHFNLLYGVELWLSSK
jgi:hypothetical protein